MPQYDNRIERPPIETTRRSEQVTRSPKSKRTVPRMMAENTWSGKLTAKPTIPTQMNKMSSNIAAGSQNISSSFLGSFAGTSVAILALVAAIALAWISIGYKRTAYTKKLRGYGRLYDTEQPEREVEGKKLKIILIG